MQSMNVKHQRGLARLLSIDHEVAFLR